MEERQLGKHAERQPSGALIDTAARRHACGMKRGARGAGGEEERAQECTRARMRRWDTRDVCEMKRGARSAGGDEDRAQRCTRGWRGTQGMRETEEMRHV